MITQQFDLNLIPNQAPVIVDVDQYDTGTGRFVISLYKDDVPYTPASASAVIQGTKPDGHSFSYPATLSGNTVTANLMDQMTAVAGNVRTQIVVTEASGRTGTFAFILRVQKSALPDDADLSESDYPLIEQAIEAAGTAVSAAESASESQRAAASSEEQALNAATRATGASNSAFTYMQYASNSANNASSAASNSEAYAVGKRGGTAVPSTDPAYHNNSKFYSEQAGDSATSALNSKNAAKLSEQNAKASEDILSFYADFVAPHFIIQNNRLYINDPSIGDFVVANNRLYFKLAS